MVVKTVFKSHFKIKRSFLKNSKKKIFVKNMVVFLLFTKIFFKGCVVNFFFTKNRNNKINILKAPSRHKKFFHQLFYEYFIIKVNFFFKKTIRLQQHEGSNNLVDNLPLIFLNMNSIFSKINSNTLSRTKLSTSFNCYLLNPLQNNKL